MCQRRGLHKREWLNINEKCTQSNPEEVKGKADRKQTEAHTENDLTMERISKAKVRHVILNNKQVDGKNTEWYRRYKVIKKKHSHKAAEMNIMKSFIMLNLKTLN